MSDNSPLTKNPINIRKEARSANRGFAKKPLCKVRDFAVAMKPVSRLALYWRRPIAIGPAQ
jgi:hypothetical protein